MKYQYKTVDTSTEKGILEAERLMRNGWKIISQGFLLITFEKELD